MDTPPPTDIAREGSTMPEPSGISASPPTPVAWMSPNLILVLLAAVVIIAAIAGYLYFAADRTSSVQESMDSIRIGFSLGTLREERWQRDIEQFTARAEELGATVIPAYANDNAQLQLTQTENLIVQGVDILVVVPQDGVSAAAIVERAHEAGIPVIAYDRLITHDDLDLFITFDSRVVGELEAAEIVRRVGSGSFSYIGGSTTDNNAFLHKEGAFRVLQPLIDDMSITLVLETFTPGWRPEEAYADMTAFLDGGGRVDAVVAANDGTASGVILALEEHGLAGSIPVAGQDAELAACRRIVAGTQAATVYKPLRELAHRAAEAAIAIAKDAPLENLDSIRSDGHDVPAIFVVPILVTEQNLRETVVADGFHSEDEVFGE